MVPGAKIGQMACSLKYQLPGVKIGLIQRSRLLEAPHGEIQQFSALLQVPIAVCKNEVVFLLLEVPIPSAKIERFAHFGNRTVYRHGLYIDTSKSPFDIQCLSMYSESSTLYIDR